MANILIIDDDQNLLRLLEFTLSRAGHTVSSAEDGIKGLVQAEIERPDLIVIDVMMPTMNGFEFCRRARLNPRLEETPIVLFSAQFDAVDKEKALQAGATDYLPKTTSANDLLKRIADLLPSRKSPPTSSIIAVLSLRGGAGSTTLAVNLAVAIALTRQTPTGLIDLARLGGHAALMLGLRPQSSVYQALAASKHNFTFDALKPHLSRHDSGVQLLASASDYDYQLRLTDKGLEPLIVAFKSNFRYTVLDMPHVLEPEFASCLQLFDKILVVLSPDRLALQSTMIALQGLARFGIAEEKIMLVVNHLRPSGELPLDAVQEMTRRSGLAPLPYDPEMTTAIKRGVPLVVSRPESTGAAAIVNLAEELVV